jgi:hypothetical protein
MTARAVVDTSFIQACLAHLLLSLLYQPNQDPSLMETSKPQGVINESDEIYHRRKYTSLAL